VKILGRIVTILVIAAVIGVAWIVLGPGPMKFAGGKTSLLVGSEGPTGVPAELASASLVQRGEYLARVADCEACHTSESGRPFAGGRAFVLPFGTLYSTNITADPDTGIGRYSDAEFLRAMHEGIGRDGTRLYPAMPYAAYTYITDADALAIKAYLFSLKPVHTPLRANTMRFPYDQRWLMSFWSLFFNPDKRFEPNAERSAQWNRGAYLAEALAHCGECHTPRNLMQGLDNRRKYGGTIQAGWHAYNITSDHDSGVGSWTDEELGRFIASGHADGHGTAAGPMGEAVDLSLRYLAPADVAAIVAYVKTVPAIASSDLPAAKATAAPTSHLEGVAATTDPRGKELYEGVCASCHDWTGISPVTPYATLTGSRAVNDPAATNVAQIVLSGTVRRSPHGTVFMPAFGDAYSDVEVAAVANYVTARFGAQPSTLTAANVADLRQQIAR